LHKKVWEYALFVSGVVEIQNSKFKIQKGGVCVDLQAQSACKSTFGMKNSQQLWGTWLRHVPQKR
jgi:hypothetical protein